MPQLHLPVFPSGTTVINSHLAFEERNGEVTYFYANHPVFKHEKEDLATFRMITAQFCVNGSARQCEIIKAFGVTKISVLRAVNLYRKQKTSGFYKPRNTRGASVLTEAVLVEAQKLLDQNYSPAEIGATLNLKTDTVRKAIRGERLKKNGRIS